MMRKGQEEIVGFVVVVVLVAVVFLIFLSLSLRSEPSARESVTVDQFLQSVYAFTTRCSFSAGADYAPMGEVLSGCAQERVCDDGTSSCSALNSTLPDLIANGLRVGPDKPLKGYKFSASVVGIENGSLKSNGTASRFYYLASGNCSSGQQRGSSEFSPANGELVRAELILCG